jgi:hypothetical protein
MSSREKVIEFKVREKLQIHKGRNFGSKKITQALKSKM